eukprot:CAMPEP_0183566646 /NCGR_PEP_ID=MMETSP0371-20130417/112350_1 /TAXON_ID=268820 /ORGANISM="Peridinium aciculiferum, Strain PAER-2" /LENGTH=78 /DNA_ID=CAMNT_0025775947 /DNA_START=154 /DNA_END=386 /DNA_ORIENTATION=-
MTPEAHRQGQVEQNSPGSNYTRKEPRAAQWKRQAAPDTAATALGLAPEASRPCQPDSGKDRQSCHTPGPPSVTARAVS